MARIPKHYPSLDKLFSAQGGLCFYCGKPPSSGMTRDHLIPLSRGGFGKQNIVGACGNCNHAKANMTLQEFLDTDYLKEPRRQLLGAHGPPSKVFHAAKKEHEERRKLPVLP